MAIHFEQQPDAGAVLHLAGVVYHGTGAENVEALDVPEGLGGLP